jgi:hypothetical protein
LLDHLRNLVNARAVRIRPGAPLATVDTFPQFAICVGPFIPDSHAVLFKIGDVCLAPQKPKQFVNNGFEVQLFSRDEREALLQIETHLITKNRKRTRAGAIFLFHASLKYVAHQVKILFHCPSSAA